MTAEEMYIDIYGEVSIDDHTSYNMIKFAEMYHRAKMKKMKDYLESDRF